MAQHTQNNRPQARITVTPLTAMHSLKCPACGHAVLIASPDRIEVPDGPWLFDGDTIPGVYEGLTAAQRRAVTDDGLLVGTCHACHHSYYAVMAIFAAGMAFKELVSYGFERSPVRCALCSAPGYEPWLLEQYNAGRALVRRYTFGPLPLADEADVRGPFGVSACCAGGGDEWAHASKLLLGLWDALANARLPAAG